jgi:biopolymer transport protein ExbD
MRQRKHKKMLTPDLTPLIDVTFQLLIFFMVSASFLKQGGLELVLPKSQVELKKENIALEIVIDKHGNYYVLADGQAKEFQWEELDRILEGVQNVSISGDQDLKYHKVTDLISEIKASGVQNIILNLQQ